MLIVFGLYHKVFGSRIGEDHITTTIYELQTYPEHALTLQRILYKASKLDNKPTFQLIPYGIQWIAHKVIYTCSFRNNVIISDNSIIAV